MINQKQTKRLLDILPKHRTVIDAVNHTMAHATYNSKEIENIPATHRIPERIRDRLAFYSVKTVRSFFDLISGYNEVKMPSKNWINRCIFLETIAGVPGMVGGMTLHLKSLVTMKEEMGVINHLLEEAENERTHLFIFLHFK
jgi:hypothetical protein